MKFKATPVTDGKYGSLERGVWTGMIKELKDGVSNSAQSVA